MHRAFYSSLLFSLPLAISAIALADMDPAPAVKAEAESVDATVTLDGGAVAVGVGYAWGHGQITYQGASHSFKISGISVRDVGVSNLSASGSVSHLTKLSDFAGNYVAFDAGATVGGGASATYLKNEHGVVMKLVSTTVGLRFTLSANGVRVTLNDKPY